jgi:carbonic anhydrase
MTTTLTLTDTDGTKWTSGSRGKPPKWVSIHPDYIAFKEQKALEVPKDTPVAVGPQTDARLKFWKWIGLEDFSATQKCVVVAHSRTEALRELNKTFKNPVSKLEWDTMWCAIEPNEFMPQSIGAYELKGESWIKR